MIGTLLLAAAVAALPDGRVLAEKADTTSNRGYGGQRAQAKLTTIDEAGAERTFAFTQLWREGEADGSGTATLIRFQSPPDVAGNAFLAIERPKQDDRWLYLASGNRLKRISSEEQTASFLGSELTFEDVTYAVLDRYRFETIGEAEVGGRPCFRVRRHPRGSTSAYRSTDICYDKERGYAVEMKFLDRAGTLVKIATLSEHTEASPGRWRAHRVEVRNVQTKKRAVWSTSGFAVGLDLSPRLFTPAQMQKGLSD